MTGQPSAESFLNLIHRSRRGRLKVYVGYGPGVGKTYQMLLEGHRLKAQGIDAVVGIVETHGRVDTESLCLGLPEIPPRQINYRGVTLRELNLEGLVRRKPEVALIDELAHTNVPGSTNTKRYQDVLEVLAAGIHVVTTLNVQHLESLYDTVERLIGVKVKERIPDWVLADADQIVNVDLAPEDLRRRLEEGRVYAPERAAAALDNFFRAANLEQLRELTLREVASIIERRSRRAAGEEGVQAPDQIVVCLSSRSPDAPALLRYASRLAGKLNRGWYALYVQTSSEDPARLDAETRKRLADTLALAHQLGAVVFTFKGEDIADTILRFAREYRVGHVVVGRPGDLPLWQRLLGRRTAVERLIAGADYLAVVVVDEIGVRDRLEAAASAAGARTAGSGGTAESAGRAGRTPAAAIVGTARAGSAAAAAGGVAAGTEAAAAGGAAEGVAGVGGATSADGFAAADAVTGRTAVIVPLASRRAAGAGAGAGGGAASGGAVSRGAAGGDPTGGTRISQLLAPETMAFFDTPVAKRDLLRVLVDLLGGRQQRLSSDDILRLLERREQEASTFLSEGIALPHVRIPDLEAPRVALGLLRAGLADAGAGSLEQVFLFLCPDRRPEGCLQLLAAGARMYRQSDLRAALRRATVAQQVIAAIRAWEESQEMRRV
jgi:mannitol/fructose-specific phosphotransferase system IIA component (Ntr-type)